MGGSWGGVPLQKSTHQKKHPSYGARLLGPNDRSDTSTSLILGLYSLDPLDSPIFYKCNCHAGDDGILGEGVWAILNHRENGGTLGMVPLIINPIYTLYSGYILVISPFKGLLGGLNSLGNHLKGTRIFPRIEYVTSSSFTDEFFFSGSASKTDFAKRFWQTNSVCRFLSDIHALDRWDPWVSFPAFGSRQEVRFPASLLEPNGPLSVTQLKTRLMEIRGWMNLCVRGRKGWNWWKDLTAVELQ